MQSISRKILATASLAFASILAPVLTNLAAAAQTMQPQAPQDARSKLDREDLAAPLRDRGEVRVIVELRVAPGTAGVSVAADKLKAQDVSSRQKSLMARLSGQNVRTVKMFRYHPFAAMTVDEAALSALLADPDVISIAEDRKLYPLLNNTPGITRADKAWAVGFRGSGQTIAILDSGVDTAHPFFAGKIVAEACFSTAAGEGFTSYCPNPDPPNEQFPGTHQIGPGAGIHCPDAHLICWHGTHVAGIAAGKSGVLSATGSGIAPDANIIPIQVFQRDCAAGPCEILAFESDMISALEYVYSLRNTHNIAAANMSLGGGQFTAACDVSAPAMTAVVDSLRSAGIATVVASGNSGHINAISFPACISSTISVGATSKTNVVPSFSNSSTALHLLAPGAAIVSSMPGGGFAGANGTSMATPHVAGAWAVLKSAQPNATVDQILAALQSGGLPIADTRNGIVKSLIQIGYDTTTLGALGTLLGHGNLPSTVSITAPSNGATFTAPANISFSASASDTDGGVTKVEYFSGSTKIFESSLPPYTFTWSNVPIGSYSLTAVATDAQGATTASAPINISVSADPNAFQIRGTITTAGTPLGGVTLTGDAGTSCTLTDATGQYLCTVPPGYSGILTPSLSGYTFTPPARNYNNVASHQNQHDYLASAKVDTIWVQDAIPSGGVPGGNEPWTWVSTDPTPFSGSAAHRSIIANGIHQHNFNNATATLSVGTGDTLFTHVYLDPANPPSQIMLQWNDGTWEHRAYWGGDLILWGINGSASRRFMGPLPPLGQWVRLEVPAALVGLENRVVRGMSFTLFNGRATWDAAGKSTAATIPTFVINGAITAGGAPLGGVSISAGGGAVCGSSNTAGIYSCSVPQGFTGSITPSLNGYTFTPPARSYNSVSTNLDAQNYSGNTAPPPSFALIGTVTTGGAPLSGVSLGGGTSTNCTVSNAAGQYQCTVPQGYTGTITPSLSGYTFAPPSRSYSNVSANQSAQNYTATITPPPNLVISGVITENGSPRSGVSFSGAGASCNVSNAAGAYSCIVPQGYTGTITPALSGYTFTPPARSYSSVTADQPSQDYSAVVNPDTVWVEDAIPAGGTPGGNEAWNWVSSNPSPFSGTLAHRSDIVAGMHQHHFNNATASLSVGVGDTLFAYVYLDPANPPSQVMLQWNDGTWEHRAYWGADAINWGVNGTASRRFMGPLPATGQWVRLEVPAALVGLENRVLRGMAFTLFNGRATWDVAGKR